MTESKQELATVGENTLAAAGTENFLSEIAEEMDGLGDISFDSIKIPSGGGLAFEVPGDDPENPGIEKEICGVILVPVRLGTLYKIIGTETASAIAL